jgi:hypothetical protein
MTKYEGVALVAERNPGLIVTTLADAFEMVTGRVLELGRGRVKEDTLVTSTFPEILANALNVSFLARYLRRDYGERTIARYGRARDTRPRRVVQLGAYQGPLPTVAEGDLYLPLGPLEEATTTFSLSKKGGTQDLSMEVFVNDNVQFLQHVVEAMADLARTALATAVWQPWVSNANAPDGVPWFDATHNNVQTGALTEANVVAAITKLSAQTPPGSTTVLPSPAQVGRVILMVPPASWEAARKLNTTMGSALYGLFGEDGRYILVNPILTGTAWGVHRPSEDVESIRVDFMDAQEEPELALSGEKDSGQLFTHDRYVYRLRHWYGVGLVDWRGAVKSTGV